MEHGLTAPFSVVPAAGELKMMPVLGLGVGVGVGVGLGVGVGVGVTVPFWMFTLIAVGVPLLTES